MRKGSLVMTVLFAQSEVTPTTKFTVDTSVTFVSNPKEHSSQLLGEGILKSCVVQPFEEANTFYVSSRDSSDFQSWQTITFHCSPSSYGAGTSDTALQPTICNNPTAWRGTTHTFHRQNSSIYKLSIGTTVFPLDSWSLRAGPIGCPETSVGNYHYMLHNNSEERISQLLGDRSLKSNMSGHMFQLQFIIHREVPSTCVYVM
jgi:hypothetical protein